MTIVPAEHPTFREFQPWNGRVGAGFDVNFVGQLTDVRFVTGWADEARMKDRDAWPPYPQPSEENFEWLTILKAILEAKDRFVMIEAGAGYGRWLVSAACAIRQRRPDLSMLLVGIEGDPTHFRWMQKHFLDNGLDPSDHRLIQAALAEDDGVATFITGDDPAAWYGQAMVTSTKMPISAFDKKLLIEVPTVSLRTLLTELDYVDVLDSDIQGEERTAIPAGMEAMTTKVKRAFIETHAPEIDEVVENAFRLHHWRSEYSYLSGSTVTTEFGKLNFDTGGAQCWVNSNIV